MPSPPAATLPRAWVAHLPARLAWALTAVAVSAWAWVSVGAHQPWTVLPTALALAWWGWSRVSSLAAVSSADVLGATLAVASATGWMVANWWWHAEYLVVVRDPGFLTLSGLWLVDHPHTDIPTLGAIEAAASSPLALADAPEAWNLRADAIQPQGAKMLPATIAIGGWLAGTTGVLGANVVIGAAALLGLYALARTMMGPLAALAPMAVVGLTVAHLSLSRAPYTEPLTMLVMVVGLVILARALRQRSTSGVVAAAVVAGAATGVRIDGAVFAAGALVGIAVAVMISNAPHRWAARTLAWAALAQAAMVASGYAALWRWSHSYLERLEDNATTLMAGYGLTVAAMLVTAVALRASAVRERARTWLSDRRTSLAMGLAATIGLVALASRPWWTTVHRGTERVNHRFANDVTESFQRAAGMDVEPTRTYAEHTLTWLSYYLTWPLVLVGIAGVGWLVTRGLRGRPIVIAAVATMAAPALLYLWAPNVIPDQIWAIRRLAPAAMALIVLGACALVWHLRDRASVRWPHRRLTITSLCALGLVVAPTSTWVLVGASPTQTVALAAPLTVREMDGARQEFADLCAVIDGRAVILAGTSSHVGGIRVICDVPVVLVLGEVGDDAAASLAAPWDETVVVTRSPGWFSWTAEPTIVVYAAEPQANYRLQGIPYDAIVRRYSWRVGVVNPDGTLTPVSVDDSITMSAPGR